jgi:hypothetical protein
VNSSSVLLLKKGQHPSIGPVIEVQQLFKGPQEIADGGIIVLPLNNLTLSVLERLEVYCKRHIAHRTPHDRFSEWFNTAFQNSRFPSDAKPLAYQKEKYQTMKVTPERLQESVPNTNFTLEDLVYAIQRGHPFSEQVKVPLAQVKALLYYGFQGHPPMITMDVEKALLKVNLKYDFKRTGMLLRELANEGLIKLEEITSKKSGRRYYLWFWGTTTQVQSGTDQGSRDK